MSANEDINAFHEETYPPLGNGLHHIPGYIDGISKIKEAGKRSYTQGSLPQLLHYIETQKQFLESIFQMQGRVLANSVAATIYNSELYFRLGALFELTLLKEKAKFQRWKRSGNDHTKITKMYHDEIDNYTDQILAAFQKHHAALAGIVDDDNFKVEHNLIIETTQGRLNLETNLELWGDVAGEVSSRGKRPSKSYIALEQALDKTVRLYGILNSLNVPSIFTKGFNAKPLKVVL